MVIVGETCLKEKKKEEEKGGKSFGILDRIEERIENVDKIGGAWYEKTVNRSKLDRV